MKKTTGKTMIKQYNTILFDLDGTITDSGKGIINSVKYALKKHGMEPESEEELRFFVGPPLHESFEQYCRVDAEQALQFVSDYREYYAEKGILENEVYPGIKELFLQLKNAEKTIIVATSKPEVYAKQILNFFGLDEWITFIAGSELDQSRCDKSEIIQYAFEHCKVTDFTRVLMVGDRRFDVEGAKARGIDSLGVLYGYGTREELETAGADYIVNTVEEIQELLLSEDGYITMK